MLGERPLCAPRLRTRIEPAARAEVARDGDEKIVRPIRIGWFVSLLGFVGASGCEPITESRKQARRKNRLHCWPAHPKFARMTHRGPDDRVSGNLGLEDRRYRLKSARQFPPYPIELRRVECRELHHRQMNLRAVVACAQLARFANNVWRPLGINSARSASVRRNLVATRSRTSRSDRSWPSPSSARTGYIKLW